LLCQLWQVLAVGAVLVAAVTLVAVGAVSAALPVAALVPRQLSTGAAFEQHRLSGVHTSPEEALAD
jgi:hypothetical protein